MGNTLSPQLLELPAVRQCLQDPQVKAFLNQQVVQVADGETTKKRAREGCIDQSVDDEDSMRQSQDDEKSRLSTPPPKQTNISESAFGLQGRSSSVVARLDSVKLFGDAVHGHIEFPPMVMKIIDTPEFQRLRYLRQLGSSCFVFPGADHARFEHCLGVSHLAGKLVRTLQQTQPLLDITETDVLCVEIAGLCHDLGHGPFSHVFDGKFIPMARPGSKWTHEDSSIRILRHIRANHPEVGVAAAKYNLLEADWTFIEELIDPPKNIHSTKVWPCKGRTQDKLFLYQIVANKFSGIDVDKWDYLSRDALRLGMKQTFDHNRLLKMVRVLYVDGKPHICYRDKESEIVYDMFHTRLKLHRLAYQHTVGNCISQMVCEALLIVDRVLEANLQLPAESRDPYFEALFGATSFSRAIDPENVKHYVQLTDSIYERILYSTHPALATARQILEQIQRRQHWKCVGSTSLPRVVENKEFAQALSTNSEAVRREVVKHSDSINLTFDDIFLNLVKYNYGMGHSNPVDKVYFWRKDKPDTAFLAKKEQVSMILPEVFAEQRVVMYCKKRDPLILSAASSCFLKWCQSRNLTTPLGGPDQALQLTPARDKVPEPLRKKANRAKPSRLDRRFSPT